MLKNTKRLAIPRAPIIRPSNNVSELKTADVFSLLQKLGIFNHPFYETLKRLTPKLDKKKRSAKEEEDENVDDDIDEIGVNNEDLFKKINFIRIIIIIAHRL